MTAVNHFELFGLEPAFELDTDLLMSRYRERVSECHPDRFAHGDAREQRLAVERSADLNAACETLRHPTLRARYLLELEGHPVPLEATVQDPGFLMQQMEWREELEELRDAGPEALPAFRRRLKAAQQAQAEVFAGSWQDPQARPAAEQAVRRMQFLDKLMLEFRQLEEQMDDD